MENLLSQRLLELLTKEKEIGELESPDIYELELLEQFPGWDDTQDLMRYTQALSRIQILIQKQIDLIHYGSSK